MLLLSYGVTKSGSSLAFSLARSILIAAGYEQQPLDERFVEPDRDINYVEALDEAKLLGLVDAVPSGGFVAVKTHSGLSPAVMSLCEELIADEALKVHAVKREPRDICLALVDAGNAARATGSVDFSNISTLDDAIEEVLNQTQNLLSWSMLQDCLILDYDAFAFDLEATAAAMAAHLGVNPNYRPMLDHPDPYSTHTKNKAVPSRHLVDLQQAEADQAKKRLAFAFKVYDGSADPEWLSQQKRALLSSHAFHSGDPAKRKVTLPPPMPILAQTPTLHGAYAGFEGGLEMFVSPLPVPLPSTGVKMKPGAIPFRSESCSSHHYFYDCFAHWCAEMKARPVFHRKQWEFVYILHALWERGMLAPDRRGLGFGVGREPLTAVMAKHGCEICATDLAADEMAATAWSDTNQHAHTLAELNGIGICPESLFDERVSFRPANMNDIPDDLRGFDFTWSACCFEHLGSIENGLRFYKESLATLKPGGICIHTTELNLSSDTETLDNAATVLFRRSDLLALIEDLEAEGHRCEPLLVHYGSQPVDFFLDVPPYIQDPHLRLQVLRFATTSVGIITQKALPPS